jgi:hypothetical protein
VVIQVVVIVVVIAAAAVMQHHCWQQHPQDAQIPLQLQPSTHYHRYLLTIRVVLCMMSTLIPYGKTFDQKWPQDQSSENNNMSMSMTHHMYTLMCYCKSQYSTTAIIHSSQTRNRLRP